MGRIRTMDSDAGVKRETSIVNSYKVTRFYEHQTLHVSRLPFHDFAVSLPKNTYERIIFSFVLPDAIIQNAKQPVYPIRSVNGVTD